MLAEIQDRCAMNSQREAAQRLMSGQISCRPDIDSAERLVRERKVNHSDASKPVKVSIARLVKKCFAARGDYEWEPTEKLMNDINCWYEARECVW